MGGVEVAGTLAASSLAAPAPPPAPLQHKIHPCHQLLVTIPTRVVLGVAVAVALGEPGLLVLTSRPAKTIVLAGLKWPKLNISRNMHDFARFLDSYVDTECPKSPSTLCFWHFFWTKLFQNVKVGDVLKNSGNLLHNSHKNFEIPSRNG